MSFRELNRSLQIVLLGTTYRDRAPLSTPFAVLIALLLWTTSAHADDWTDQVVFPRRPQLPLRYGKRTVDKIDHWARVIRDRGDWIEVRHGEGSSHGYVLKTEVLRTDTAARYYAKYLQRHPDSIWAHLNRSMACEEAGQTLQSLKELSATLKKLPAAPLYVRRAILHFLHGDYELCLADCDTALQLDPQSSSAYHTRGNAKAMLKDYAGAIRDLDQSIELDANSPTAFINRAKAYRSLGDATAARADLDQALKLDPTCAPAYRLRGNFKSEARDFAGALDDIRQAIRYGDRSPEARLTRAALKVKLGQLDDACKDFSQLIERNPDLASAYSARAAVRVMMGHLNEALDDFTHVIRLCPQDKDAYFERGLLQQELLDEASALEDFTAALSIDPTFHPALIQRGRLHSRLGASELALADFSEAIRLSPQTGRYCAIRAAALEHSDPTAALADYDAAILHGEDRPQVYRLRAGCRLHEGDFRGAIADYDLVIRLDPGDESDYELRAHAKERIGDFAGAIADHEQVLTINPEELNTLSRLALLLATAPDPSQRNAKQSHELADRALRILPTDGRAMNAKACAFALEENFAEALVWQKRALSDRLFANDPRNSVAAQTAAWQQKKLWLQP